MNLKELLMSNGLEEEKAEAVISEMKANKIYITAEENMDVRYPKLKTQYESLKAEIEELKKNSKEDENYKIEVERLEKELENSKKDSALKLELIEAGVKDVEYIMFKAGNLDLDIELDDNGNVKGMKDILEQLKTQYPKQFENSQLKKVEENKLPEVKESPQVTKEQFNRMSYHEKNELYNTNKKLYEELRGEENDTRND